MRVSVVIPVFNERHTIEACIRHVLNAPYDKEIIVVDDGSTDGTRELVAQLGTRHPNEIRVLCQPQNRGKGAALRRGFEEASGDVVIVQDADLEYDPQDYAVLVHPIEAGKADVVYGSRFVGGEHRVLYFWHTVGNKLLTMVSNAFTNLNLTDMETCYKVFRRQVIQNIVLESDRFGFEPEITAKIAKAGCVVYEVPIAYHGRTYEQGKKITWRDGFSALWQIFKFNVLVGGECIKRDWSAIPGLVMRREGRADTRPAPALSHARH